jgi:hypothetical protein
MLRILALTFLLFFPASALTGYATSPHTMVPTDWFSKEVGVVRVCPSPELTHDTEKAVEEWILQ